MTTSHFDFEIRYPLMCVLHRFISIDVEAQVKNTN